MPGDFSQPDQNQSSQGKPEMMPSQADDDAAPSYETDRTPVLTEEEIAQLQEEDADIELYTLYHSFCRH